MIGKYISKLAKRQEGYASFVISLVTIIVVSLIVVAFAADSRLEQKNTLNNNISEQAYYAADSGINDAKQVVSTLIADSQPVPAYTSGCNTTTYGALGTINSAGSATVKYSCLIIDPSPSSLIYQEIDPGQPLVTQLTDSASANIGTITISWSDKDPSGTGFGNCPTSAPSPSLPVLAPVGNNLSNTNCNAGLLQVDLISSAKLGNELLTASTEAISQAQTVFLEPLSSGGLATMSLGGNAVTYQGVACSNGECSEAITVTPDSTYYLRMQDFYAPESLSITAQTSGGTPRAVNFANSQILIDSTGYANGQYKRIQERVCDGDYCNDPTSAGAIVSNLCVIKNFYVKTGSAAPPVPNPTGCTNTSP